MGITDSLPKKSNKIALSVFAEFFNKSSLPCYLKGADLKYLAASQSFAEFVGVTSDKDLLGKTDEQLFGDDESCKKHTELEKKVLQEGVEIKDTIVPVTIKNTGDIVYCKTTKFPVVSKGKVIAIMGTSVDYTRTYEAEQRFEKMVSNYLSLPNNALCCAYVDVTDWKMIDFSAIINGKVEHRDMSIDEFITRSDRLISVDISEHRYFANLDKENILKKFNEGLPGHSIEFYVNTEEYPSRWVNYDYFFLVDPRNSHVCILFSVLDISKQREEKDNLVKAAEQDLMTEVYNHEAALSKMSLHLQDEGMGELNALFIIDVDNFKEINDHFGHRTGDNVLVEISDKIKKTFRDYDIIGRIGGDEFIVLMKNLEKAWDANKKSQELINALQFECQRNGESIALSSSIGVIVFTATSATKLDDLYSDADAALYKAKKLGKNKVVFSEDSDINSFAMDTSVADISINLQTVLNGIDGIFVIAEITDDDISIVYTSDPRYDQYAIELMPAEEYNALLYTIKKAHESGNSEVDFTASSAHDYRGVMRWLRVKGSFIEADKPNTLKLMALVQDIAEFKNNELALKMENTKHSLALSISHTITWEYDAVDKTIALHDSDSKPIPYVNDDMVFPEYYNAYVKLYKDIDSGVDSGTEYIHFKSIFGKNMWMQVSFKTRYNDSGHVIGALFAAHDVTNFMTSMDKYETGRHLFNKAYNERQTCFHINLTKDTLISASYEEDFINANPSIKQASEFLKFFGSLIVTTKEKRDYSINYFSAENFMNLMSQNVDNIDDDFLFNLSTSDSEWFRVRLFLVINPETREREVFGFLKNVNDEHTSQMIIDRIFNFEYELLAVLDTKHSTIKVLQDKTSHLKTNEKMDYEDVLYESVNDYVVENQSMDFIRSLEIRNIEKELRKHNVYVTSFSVYEKMGNDVLLKHKRYLCTYLDDAKRYIAVTKSDVTDQYRSEFDQVTGLYNRSSFYKKCRELIDSDPRTTYVIVRWDIDKFKLYNDLFGAIEGDELLASVGSYLRDKYSKDIKSNNPEKTVVGNLGGDNFALCMPKNMFDPQAQVDDLAEMFNDMIKDYQVTFHMAGYVVNEPNLDISLMCDRAMFAVKTIKDKSTPKFAWYEESMREAEVKELELITEIHEAIDNDEFVIYIQPQFNQMTSELVSGESLIRWIKSDGTVVQPSVFVPLLEKTGLVTKVDQLIWEKTCQFLSKRKKEGKFNVPIAVNISRKDFYINNLCNIFYNLIEKYDIEPDLLDLEVTESAYIEDTNRIVEIINDLRNHGFSVKMDDFGSGYSSLNTLKHIPVDMIKLDMGFLYNDKEGDDNAITRGGVILDSIMRMAHWLGLPTIAEGVETEKQANFLKTLDCSIVQGYYFSKPLPTDEFEKLLEESSVNSKLSIFKPDNNFDNKEFFDSNAQTSLLFNSFIGAAGIFEYFNDQLKGIRFNSEFFKELDTEIDKSKLPDANILDIIYEEDRPAFIDMIKQASGSTEQFTLECRFHHADPNKKDDKIRWLNLRVRRIAHSEKRYLFFAGIENISRRKYLEEKNTNLAKLLTAAVNSTNNGVFTYEIINDDKLQIHAYSSKIAPTYGFTEAEFYERFGEHPIQGIHPDDRDDLLKVLRSPFSNDVVSIRHSCRHVCKDGSYKNVNFQIYKPATIGSRLVGYFVVLDS